MLKVCGEVVLWGIMSHLALDSEPITRSHTVERAAINTQDGGSFLFISPGLFSNLHPSGSS